MFPLFRYSEPVHPNFGHSDLAMAWPPRPDPSTELPVVIEDLRAAYLEQKNNMREYEDYSYYFGTFINVAYDLGYSLDASKECDNNEDYNIGIGIQLMPDENS